MQSMHIQVLGSEGAGRAALESALTGLGCTISAADEHGSGTSAPVADVLMLDARGDQAALAGLAAEVVADERPALVVSERPSPLVAQLARRQAGTILVTGAESQAGFRVALSLLAALGEAARARTRAAQGDSPTRTAIV